MRNIWTIAKREYDHYFISPIAYIVAFAILLAIGIVFGINFFYFTQNAYQNFGAAPDLSPVTGVFAFILVLSTPALTMRLISDEARMGTLELLLTAPIKDSELVIGKPVAPRTARALSVCSHPRAISTAGHCGD